MNPLLLRNGSRRLTGELALIIALAGFPIHFPRSVPATQSWRFLATHPTLVLHVLVGVLIVVEAGRLSALGVRSADKLGVWIGCLGAASVAGAFIAGISYTHNGQTDSSLNLMSMGALTAFTVYVTGWALARKRVRQAEPSHTR